MSQEIKLKQEMQAIAEKLSEIEAELEEYDVVIEALKPLDGNRKCHRLVNGVLVERNVSQVLPALKSNYDNVKKLQAGLINSYKNNESELRRDKNSCK